MKVDFEEFDYGISYKRITEITNEKDPLWTIGRVCLWPNALYTGEHFEWRVPIDDENTLSITWSFDRVPKEREPYVQNRIPTWNGPIKDETTGRWIDTHVMNQDFIAWVGQGTVADRSKENLAASDKGIALQRRQFFADLDAIKEGKDPKGLVRDPKINECVPLPIAFKDNYVNGLTAAEMVKHPVFSGQLSGYVFQTGQPEEVRRAFVDAMGIELNARRRDSDRELPRPRRRARRRATANNRSLVHASRRGASHRSSSYEVPCTWLLSLRSLAEPGVSKAAWKRKRQSCFSASPLKSSARSILMRTA